ncbi:MAG: hypothetical protein AAFP69_05000, partial [Planctomycetota bacterium]
PLRGGELYFGKRLVSFHLQTADLDGLQTSHVERLNEMEEHPDKVDDDDAMYDEIIGSLITLEVFTRDDIRRPIQLPYASIGTLFKGRDEFLQQLRSSLRDSGDHPATAITVRACHLCQVPFSVRQCTMSTAAVKSSGRRTRRGMAPLVDPTPSVSNSVPPWSKLTPTTRPRWTIP